MLEQPYRDFSAGLNTQAVLQHRLLKAQFEITYRCNLRCAHCYTDPYNTPEHLRRELSFPEIERILDGLADAGTLYLCLTGGEAVTHPHFREIYAAAVRKGFVLSLYTNGTMISESIADFLAESPPFQIEISMQALAPAVFDAITTVGGSQARCIEGIERLARRGLPIKVKASAMSLNNGQIPALSAWAAEKGFSFQWDAAIYPRLNGDLSSTELRATPEDIVAMELTERPGGCKRSELPVRGSERERLFRCGCGTSAGTISPYGFLRACTFTTEPQFDLKTMPVKEAFQGLVEAIQSQFYEESSTCRSCTATPYCDKNPVAAMLETGSKQAPVPHFCNVAFARQHAFEESFAV